MESAIDPLDDDKELTESEKELLNLIISQIINQILPCLQ
jgi:hypothetical protein